MEYSVTNLYREIGQFFLQNGVERVVLLSSKNNSNPAYEMEIEVAVDGLVQVQKVQLECENRWPEIKITVIDLNNEKNRSLCDELMEDGIII